ncbi:hypothetical protein [Flavobacterium sp. CLA17]|uniref:hypothetical protein n=1 Tax=Flavobacterium sp. CLA17 TaxID=2724135 RepID=UPI00149092A4|nr:hypothetical protein [Flavobacterium sp. CLA17]QSB26478.1 hypothetical protein HAV12_019240 [Flavobacterium sp. CLA17]
MKKKKNEAAKATLKLKPVKVEWTTRGVLKLLIAFIILFGAFALFLEYSWKSNKKEVKFIESDYSYVKAKITNKSTYKTWTLTVAYKVGDKTYKESEAVRNNSLKIGDSIWIKYSNTKPNLIIIDLQ